MDYDLENENDGLGKGPFYGAAAFLFLVIALFASVTLKEQGTLGIGKLHLVYWAQG